MRLMDTLTDLSVEEMLQLDDHVLDKLIAGSGLNPSQVAAQAERIQRWLKENGYETKEESPT